MDKLVKIASKHSKRQKDDDFADRLSSRFTVVILVVFTITISMNNWVRKPITCWAPKHFTGSHTKYANSYCWVRNTYYLPWDREIPKAHEEDQRQMLPYYQWIPFILLAQAVLFYIPSAFWHALNDKAGVDSDDILVNANKVSKIDSLEQRKKMMVLLVNQIHRFLSTRRTVGKFKVDVKSVMDRGCCRPCGRRFGNYLVLLYMTMKLLYIANVFFQMFMLNKFLGMRFDTFGADILSKMIANQDWTESAFVAFPRVTMCDFNVRRLGNVHRYTVQCVLPINLYNEKIYIFLWFWMIFIAIVTILSTIQWALRIAMRSDRIKFIRNHLRMEHRLRTQSELDKSEDFLDNYLKQDGSFILRLIAHNTNNITTTDIICALWEKYRMTVARREEEEEAMHLAPLGDKSEKSF